MADFGREMLKYEHDTTMLDVSPLSECDQPQRKRNKLIDEYQHSQDKGKVLEGLLQDFDQLNQTGQQNTSRSSEWSQYSRSSKSAGSSAATSVNSSIPKPLAVNVLVAYLATPNWEKGPLVLVKAGLGRGAFGFISVWKSLVDSKLYVRKLQRSTMDRQPADISRYISHQHIPRLLTFMKHGRPPRRLESPMHANNTHSNWWSSIHDFIEGPNLLSVIDNAWRTGYRFPEPLVWRCGLTLLDIVQKFLFHSPKAAINHNDIFPRNILVTNDAQQKSPSNFHLIDFGVATTSYEKALSSYDLYCITDVLYSMMLGRVDVLPRFAYCNPKNKGPYSAELQNMVWRLWMNADPHCVPSGYVHTVNEIWLAWFINDWRIKTDMSFEHHSSLGTDLKIPLKYFKIEPLIRGWQGENAVQDMTDFLDNVMENDVCVPFQKAWVNSETLQVVKVEDKLTWTT